MKLVKMNEHGQHATNGLSDGSAKQFMIIDYTSTG